MSEFYVDNKSPDSKFPGRRVFNSFEEADEWYSHMLDGNKKICPELRSTFTLGKIIDLEIKVEKAFYKNDSYKDVKYKCIKCDFIGINEEYTKKDGEYIEDVVPCSICSEGHMALKCPNCGELYDFVQDKRRKL